MARGIALRLTVAAAVAAGSLALLSQTLRYHRTPSASNGPFHVEAELWYQPVGFRWAHNLETYKAEEPRRFVGYYDAEARQSAVLLAHAAAIR